MNQNATSAINSVESELSFSLAGSSTEFIGYINTLFDYIMNLEYFTALKFNVPIPANLPENYTASYTGPMDFVNTNANDVLTITDLSASDYFLYSNRYGFYTRLTPGVRASYLFINDSDTETDRGAYDLLFPLLFDFESVLDFLDVATTDVPADLKVLFFYGDYDFRFRHSFNSGSDGMCATYFSHYNSSSDDSAGNCQIKPAYSAGHVVRGTPIQSVYDDISTFVESL